ncbi:acyltransferase family protein [Nocardiopsis halophila]|uniref:acyltransferase family protein n=1 Tax=Nocardiopsis halophila TaxID=141692 RepID=UPI00037D3590|nr:acyltransferase [Nocardiopsis halophila]
MSAAAPEQENHRPPAPLPQVRGHNAPLDGIRAIAALMVLVFHVAVETGAALAPGVRGALLSAAELAVPLFFGLSGLLLYRPWVRACLDGSRGPDVRVYLWKRALRVLPAYWIVAVAALLLWSREQLGSVGTWFEVLTLTFTYDTDPWWVGTGPYGLGQMWSLCVEVSFYALLPLIALVLGRYAMRGRDADERARRLLIGLGALAALGLLVLVPQFYPEPRPYMHAWLPRTLGLFAVGMALAVLTEWAWREKGADGPVRRLCRTLHANTTLCWILAAILYALNATPAGGPRFVGVDGLWISVFATLTAMGFAFFFIAPVAVLPAPGAAPRPYRWRQGAWLETLLSHRVSLYLGKVSYGIFLWQFVVLYLWRDFTGQEIFTGSFWLDMVPVTGGTVLLAHLTHRWVEEPSRRLVGWVRPAGAPRRPKPSLTGAPRHRRPQSPESSSSEPPSDSSDSSEPSPSPSSDPSSPSSS